MSWRQNPLLGRINGRAATTVVWASASVIFFRSIRYEMQMVAELRPGTIMPATSPARRQRH